MTPEAAIAFACRSAIAVGCGSVWTADRPWACRYCEIISAMSSACASVAVISTTAPSKTVFIARFPTFPTTERRTLDIILMRLGKDAPLGRDIDGSVTIVITPILSGLRHRYARI